MNREATEVREVSPGYDFKAAKPVVPEGYKQSEVGVIPVDWFVRAVFDIAECSKSRFDDGDWVEAEHITSKGVRLIQTGNIGVGKYIEKTNKKYIYESSFEKLRCKEIHAGDLLICRLAEPAGRACLLPRINESRIITSVDVTIFRPSEEVADRCFLTQYFSTQSWFQTVLNSVGGTTHKRISRGALGKLPVPFPKIEEQRAIAAALSDVDALLEELDRLIAKKRDTKQATMQQLLTGQTRLPGFEGKWETKRLGELLDRVLGGGTPSRSNARFWGGDIPWVTVKDFASFASDSSQECITAEGLGNSAANLVPAGTVITSTRMALGRALIYDVDVSINQDLKALFCGPLLIPSYLYYWFQYCQRWIEGLGSGSTVKGLSTADLTSIQFSCPPKAEQTAIITVLSEIDAELDILQQRSAKSAALKQAMMQELLTGRTRLVETKKKEVAPC